LVVEFILGLLDVLLASFSIASMTGRDDTDSTGDTTIFS
jgi:hypothetical protein